MTSFLALLGTTLLTCNAGRGALAFAPYQLQAAIRCPCPSATCSVALPPHKTKHVVAVRYADTADDGHYMCDNDDDDQPLFSQLPEEIFAQISDGSSTIGFDDLPKWEELQELLEDGEILISELQTFYDAASRGDDSTNELDKAGFAALYKMIDDLFEDEDEDPVTSAVPVNKEEELISFLTNDLTRGIDDLPCGMDCTDAERDTISDLVEDLVAADSNRIATIQAKDLIGAWELLYTSSKAMVLNKNLSGLTASGEENRFSAVRQTFTGSKFLGFVEFMETYNRGTPESFDVKITGEWMLQEDTRTIGSCTLQVDPENIEYGPGKASGMAEEAPMVQLGGGVSQCANWQSLGPIKLLDVIYATSDLYVAQGKFEASGLFVWRKVK